MSPTGTSIHPDEMRRIHTLVSRRGGITLVDEIYLGLSFDETYGKTALEIDDQIISINCWLRPICYKFVSNPPMRKKHHLA